MKISDSTEPFLSELVILSFFHETFAHSGHKLKMKFGAKAKGCYCGKGEISVTFEVGVMDWKFENPEIQD